MAAAVTVKGIAELKAALRAMALRADAATPLAVSAATDLVKDRSQALLRLKEHARGTPTPSASGEPPAKITGDLLGSFETLGPTPLGAGTWRERLGPTIVYARIQELGGAAGRGGASILPERPYLRPALDDALHADLIRGEFVRAWRTAITG